MKRRRAKENPAPARGRQGRIASSAMPPHARRRRASATPTTSCPTGVTLHVAEAGDPGRPGGARASTAGRSTGGCGATSSRRSPATPPRDRAPTCAAWAGAASPTTATSPRSGSPTTCSRCSTCSGWSGSASSATTGAAGPAGCVALRAPERVERLMAVSIIAPVGRRAAAALLNAWRLALPAGARRPRRRPGDVARRFARLALGRSMDAAAAAVYAGVLDDPRARRGVEPRVPALPAARPARRSSPATRTRVELPVRLLVRPRRSGGAPVASSAASRATRPRADVELVDGGPLPRRRAAGPGRRPRPRMVRLITWNVARRVEALAAQAAALGERAPDVVALQEVTARTLPLWEAALPVLGLPAVACTLRDADPARAPAGRRRTGVLLAARGARAAAGPAARSRGRRRRSRRGSTGSRSTPCTSRTPRTARSSRRRSPRCARGWPARTGPRVLCGDLNTPRREQPGRDRLVVRARLARAAARGARRLLGRERAGRRPRAGRARLRRRLPRAPRLRGAVAELDVRRIAGHGGGWRLDHVFAGGLEPVAARYHHEWRERGLSDHAALEADLA